MRELEARDGVVGGKEIRAVGYFDGLVIGGGLVGSFWFGL